MYFSHLKYALPLALAAGMAPDMETRLVPPVFEDFEGPYSLSLAPDPRRPGNASQWKIETVVPAGELGTGAITLLTLGLGADAEPVPGPPRLRGFVTLSSTRGDRLQSSFDANRGEAPVTYFVAARTTPSRTGKRRTLYLFDLPGGYRLEPGKDGNLLVHMELDIEGETRLDLAPALAPRLLLSPDLRSPTGELMERSLVLFLRLKREPSPHPDAPGRAAPAPAPPPVAAARPSAPAQPAARPVPQPAGEGGDRPDPIPEIRELRDRVARLEAQLRLAQLASLEQSRRIEAGLGELTALVARQGLEAALARGQLSAFQAPGLRARVDAGREVLREAIATARSGGLCVDLAEKHLADGDELERRGEAVQAFRSYSLGFRSLAADGDGTHRRPLGEQTLLLPHPVAPGRSRHGLGPDLP